MFGGCIDLNDGFDFWYVCFVGDIGEKCFCVDVESGGWIGVSGLG